MNNKYFKLTVIIIITLILSLFLFAGVKYYGVENFSSCGEECFDKDETREQSLTIISDPFEDNYFLSLWTYNSELIDNNIIMYKEINNLIYYSNLTGYNHYIYTFGKRYYINGEETNSHGEKLYMIEFNCTVTAIYLDTCWYSFDEGVENTTETCAEYGYWDNNIDYEYWYNNGEGITEKDINKTKFVETLNVIYLMDKIYEEK